MTLRVRVHPGPWTAGFPRPGTVRIGRGRAADVRVGHQRVQGRLTVSKAHVEVRWDGTRWRTVNVSDKPGLLAVYEPGYEEVPLEPGRSWVPVRHRWSYALGRPGQRFHVVCVTDDHLGPATLPAGAVNLPGDEAHDRDDEPTAGLEGTLALSLTPLERQVVGAYYAPFAELPRPATLEPRSHDEAAHLLGRSRDSTRKAIERVNQKIQAAQDAPAIATGRNVSGEIGRWLARSGALDPDLVQAD
ncbi:MAG TPA: hypothetical protein VFI47_02870 [Acidimicrobiales bacterium]|nr:hypothetical protein [Acidimicrobiales bacterium]